MKLRNTFVLVFAVLLLAQLLVREYYMEGYPMIVLPSGAGVYEHKTDTITASDWKATAYASKDDSARIDESDLFPGSPVQYHGPMYSSLAGADTTSKQWGNAAQWVHDNIAGTTLLPQTDSLCVYRIEKVIPLGRGESKVRYRSSSCFNFSSVR
jgi:hypothetical protein